MKSLAFAAIALLQLSLPAGTSAEPPEIERMRIDVEEASSRVGLATVRLNVSELEVEEGRLKGQYAIEVPIRRSKNDTGALDLAFDGCFADTFRKGGKLTGHGVSATYPEDPPRKVLCEIRPDPETTGTTGKIVLTVTTPDRSIEFRSHYRIWDDD